MPSRYMFVLLAAMAIGVFAADPPGPQPPAGAREIGADPAITPPRRTGFDSGDAPANIVPRPKPGEESAAPLPKANIRADVNVVLVPVTVTDPLNRFVTGLDRMPSKYTKTKSNRKSSLSAARMPRFPSELCSIPARSMGNKLERSRLSVAEFFKTANPEDEAFLVEFSDRPQLVVPMTHNLEEIQNRLTFTQSKGRTALLDGVYMALNAMKKARNPRKALILISDGGDNSSRYTATEVKNLVREADVQIYGIGIYESGAARGRTPEELSGPEMLRDLSEPTGGRHFVVENLAELPDVAAKIGIELRNQYVIGYSPGNEARDGKYRKIQVKIIQPRGLPTLHAFWRIGRFAPTN